MPILYENKVPLNLITLFFGIVGHSFPLFAKTTSKPFPQNLEYFTGTIKPYNFTLHEENKPQLGNPGLSKVHFSDGRAPGAHTNCFQK